MAEFPRPSFPSAPTEPSIRRLGVRSSSQFERPIRAQVVLAVVGALVLLAIPLYLLRRPSPTEPTELKEAPIGFSSSVPAESLLEDAKKERVSVGPPLRVRCANGPGGAGREGTLCDSLPSLEAAFAQAIVDTVDCAPRTGEEGTLNFVLKVDFNQKTLHVFPGASGSWKGPQARRATQCVKQSLPAPAWDTLEHKSNYYEIAILATYRSPKPTSIPLFE